MQNFNFLCSSPYVFILILLLSLTDMTHAFANTVKYYYIL